MSGRGTTLVAQVSLRALFFRSCVIAGLLIPIGIASTSVGPGSTASSLSSKAQSIPVVQLPSESIAVKVQDPTDYARVLSWRKVSLELVKENYSFIEQAASVEGIDPHLLRAMLLVHQTDWSQGTEGDAFGPMRISASTAAELQVTNRQSPKQSILAGAAHFRFLSTEFPKSIGLALGAYRTSVDEIRKERNFYANLVAAQYAEQVLYVYSLLLDEDPRTVIKKHMPQKPRDSLRWMVSAD
jgi:hypothetical protein